MHISSFHGPFTVVHYSAINESMFLLKVAYIVIVGIHPVDGGRIGPSNKIWPCTMYHVASMHSK